MKINLISLQTVKTQLGIKDTLTTSTGTASPYDADLQALIPIVSTDVRRILNTQFNKYYNAVVNMSDSTIILPDFSYLWPELPTFITIGTVIQHDCLPDDCYLSGYDPLLGKFTLSATPLSGDGHDVQYVYPTINVAQWPVISKMIWYKYTQQSVDYDIQDLTAENIGGVSFTYAKTESELDRRYDYPNKLIKDLGVPFARMS